jgi:HEPN domain-containing protein
LIITLNAYLCKNWILKVTTRYWLDLSDYDLETAEAMLSSGRYLYVGFMCHQTIEKVFKAFFSQRKEESPPFSHNLSHLAEKSGILKIIPDDLLDIINILEPLNVEARYPTYKEQLMKDLTDAKCKIILLETRKLQSWVKTKLL